MPGGRWRGGPYKRGTTVNRNPTVRKSNQTNQSNVYIGNVDQAWSEPKLTEDIEICTCGDHLEFIGDGAHNCALIFRGDIADLLTCYTGCLF